jgi:hypothetical protein
MSRGLPPPPIKDDLPPVLKEWLNKLYRFLGDTDNQILWDQIDTSGSSLSDITTRNHSQLQGVSGSSEQVHVSTVERQDLQEVSALKKSTVLNPWDDDPISTGQEGWADLLCDINVRGTGATDPNYNVTFAPFRAYQFTVGDEVWFNIHIPHDYKWGTPVYFHAHWLANTASTNTVTWRFSYSYAKGYGVSQFPAATVVDVTQAHSGVAWTHMIAEPPEGSGIMITDIEPDGIIMVNMKLQTNNLPVDPYCIFADLHYYSDGTLTHERNRSFTKHRD